MDRDDFLSLFDFTTDEVTGARCIRSKKMIVISREIMNKVILPYLMENENLLNELGFPQDAWTNDH